MPKRRPRRKASDSEQRKRAELETVRDINACLDASPVDTEKLRKLAAVRGLVNNQLRARAWPLLLGVGVTPGDEAELARHSGGQHRDAAVMDCDVRRSLWTYTEGWSVEARDAKREGLRRILTAVVCGSEPGPQAVHYYQGLHDVASVLLFVCESEAQAFVLLRALATTHLRDCTRPTLLPVTELLQLLPPLLRAADEELGKRLDAAGVPPFFALAWLITWFAHGLAGLAEAARLFDVFLALHPLMPLYIAAAAMMAARGAILAAEPDAAELHGLLSNLAILRAASANELAVTALELYQVVGAAVCRARAHAIGVARVLCPVEHRQRRRIPPERLLQGHHPRFVSSVLARAYMRDDHWHVPPDPPGGPGLRWGSVFLAGGAGLAALASVGKLPMKLPPRQRAMLATVAGLALSLALYLAQQSGGLWRP